MRQMSSLDLKILLEELKTLENGRIQKIFQSDKNIRIDVFVSGYGKKELYFDKGRIFLTNFKRKAPETPGSFAMLLRKYLSDQKIISVKQPRFERILEIETENYTLRLEIFSTGNAILCDKADIIIQPLEKQDWKDRTIRSGEKYKYPPQVLDPFNEKDEFFKQIKEISKRLVIFLAIRCGLSGIYAEEVCHRAGIDKNKSCKELTDEEIEKIYSTILSLTERPCPHIIEEVGPIPIKLETMQGKSFKDYKSFGEALDEYYSQSEIETTPEPMQEEKDKLTRILDQQRQSIEKWKVIEKDTREKAELLQKNYATIDNVLCGIQKANKLGMPWEKLKEMIESDPKMSSVVKEIREAEGKVVLNL